MRVNIMAPVLRKRYANVVMERKKLPNRQGLTPNDTRLDNTFEIEGARMFNE